MEPHSTTIEERETVTGSADEPMDDRDRLVPQRIDCIDCGGIAHLLTRPDDTGQFWPGDLVIYRCEDCMDRWDIIVPGEEDVDGPDPGW